MSAAAATELEVARIRRTIAELRGHLGESVRLLGELYDVRAWITLGLPSWEELCRRELPELGELLSAAERRAVVVELRRGGASLRAAATPAGVSAATAKSWCDEAGVHPEHTKSLDGRTRPGAATAPAAGSERRARPRPTNVARALLVAQEVGAAGITVHAMTRRLRLSQSATSALLSRLAADGRLEYRRPAKRGQTGRYVIAAGR